MARKSNANNNPLGDFAVNTLREWARFGNAVFNNESKDITITKSEISELKNKSNEESFQKNKQLESIIRNQEELFFTLGNILKKNDEKDREILSFRETIFKETNHNSELLQVNSTLSNMILELEHKNMMSVLEIEKLEDRTKELSGTIENHLSLINTLEETKKENATLRAKLEEAETEIKRNELEYKNKINELNKRIEKTGIEKNLRIGDLADANKTLQSRLDSLIETDKTKTEKFNALIEEMSNIRELIGKSNNTNDMHNFFKEMHHKVDSISEETTKYAGVLSTLENLHNSTESIMNDNREIISILSRPSHNSKTLPSFDEEHYIEQLNLKDASIQSLEILIEKHGNTIIELTDKTKEYERDISTLKTLLEKRKENASTLLGKISALESTTTLQLKEIERLKTLQTEKHWVESDIVSLKNEIKILEGELANARKSIKPNPELNKLVEDALRDAETRARDMMKEKEKVEKKHKEMLAIYEEESKSINIVVTQLQTENVYFKNSIARLTEENISYKNKCDKLEDDLAELREDSEKRISEIVEEYEEAESNIIHLKRMVEEYAEREKVFRKWGPASVLFKNTRQAQQH